MSSSQSYVNQLNYNIQPLFRVIDTFDTDVYPMKKSNQDRFYEIMKKTYDQTHKSTISDQKLEGWSEKFPNMIDRKIESEKRKVKKKLKDIQKSRKAKERFKTSQLRNQNIMRQLESIGYFSINKDSKMAKMRSGLENDEIIADLIQEISDPFGSDHDMVEINYDDQFKRQVQEYQNRYGHLYVVEDIEPIKERKTPKKKPISKIKSIPEKEERKTIRIPAKKVKKKLISSIVLSKNPIKITPIERLEHIKPIPKRKPTPKAKPTPKKKPTPKAKPTPKKKPTPKAKPTPKRKPTPKAKPIPKKRYKVVKRKGYYKTINDVRKWIPAGKMRVVKKKKKG